MSGLENTVQKVVVIGKATRPFAQAAIAGGARMLYNASGDVTGPAPMGAGGGSSDVVPKYTVTPLEGIKDVLKASGNTTAQVTLITVKDDNSDLATAVHAAKNADAVIVMAGTITEEGADRASFAQPNGNVLKTIGDGLDWYVPCPNEIAAPDSTCDIADVTVSNAPRNSHTVAMIQAIQEAAPHKTALVLKDNAGVAMDSDLVGSAGPAILEAWFPGQEDGHIVADLLFGEKDPSGKLPVTFPLAGHGFLDNITSKQFPGVITSDGHQTVTYSEGLNIGYRWYDAHDVTPAFPFGFGLSYTTFNIQQQNVTSHDGEYRVNATVTNTGDRAGAEVVQAYLAVSQFKTTGDMTGQSIMEPPRRLVGFRKVELDPGESQDVTITIDPDASNHPLSIWDPSAQDWVIPDGTYTVYVGNSSAMDDLASAGTFQY